MSCRRQHIQRLRADIFDVGARRVEMTVIWNNVARLQARRRKNMFGRPSLMRRKNMLEAGNFTHGALEPSPGRASRIAFVAKHQSRPLPRRHRARSAVGQQIDRHVFGVQQKNIMVRLGEAAFAMTPPGNRQCFGHLDAEWLYDRVHEARPLHAENRAAKKSTSWTSSRSDAKARKEARFARFGLA